MENLWYGIKLTSEDAPAKALMLIKQATGITPSNIKAKTSQNSCFFGCDFENDEGLRAINRLYRKLQSIGVETKLYEDGVERSIEFFESIEKLHAEIDADNSPN